jgi:polysaccharide chain length determinant protein (PEP-CTERM system associated)
MNDLIALVPKVLAELRSAWRFRWLGAAAAWAICIIGWGVIATMPDVYEASATVYVDTSSVLKPILSNQIVPPDVVAELTYVRQALLGREHLERVARENQLDAKAQTPSELNRVLNGLLRGITIETRSVSNQAGNVIATINYRHQEREKAIGVVSTLLTSLVEGTLGATREGTDTAGRFLDERIDEYENRLQVAERALADFKKENAQRLPGAEGGYFERIRAEAAALDAAERSLRLTRSKADSLRAQLQGSSPVVSTDHLDLPVAPNSLDARIRDHQRELDRLLLDYTEKHPAVIGQRESLRQLEEQRARQLRALGASNTNQEISSVGASPVYQALQIALNQTEVEIATMSADVAERQQRVAALRSLVDEVPEVEAELARLNRDYDIIYQQYQALTRSRETQSLSVKASDTDTTEFRVINPPLAEFEPVGPNRPLYLVAAFALALGAGGVMCWLVALTKPVFPDAKTLQDMVGLPVIGVVTQAFERRERRRRFAAFLSFATVVGGLAAILVLAVAIEVYGGGLHQLLGQV